MDSFLGHSTTYWIELEKKAQELGVINWLQEVAELRAKVSFYESRLDEINNFRNRNILTNITEDKLNELIKNGAKIEKI